jgi:uncharacterized membrane protein
MLKRPLIRLKLSTSDKIVELLGWMAIIGLWVLIIGNYSELPEKIPTHFNYAGKVDAYGNKVNVLILPIIASVLFVGLTILNQFPQLFNYPVTITEANAEKQYKAATKLLRYLKLIIVFVFGMIAFVTLKEARANSEAYYVWLLPLVLGMLFIPIISYWYNIKKN